MNKGLRNNIAALEDDELLHRYHSGTLVEEAQHIFLDEIERRGIDIAETSLDQVLYEQELINQADRRSQSARGKNILWQWFRILFIYGGLVLAMIAIVLMCKPPQISYTYN